MYQISQHNAAVVWQDTEIKTEAKKINPVGCAFIQLTVDLGRHLTKEGRGLE